jgi:hypothetical protein
MASVCFSIQIEDAKGANGGVKFCVPVSTPRTAATQYAQAMASAIDDLITGVITGISLTEDVALPGGLKTSVVGAADVEEGAQFYWTTAGGYKSRNRIPTFDEDKIDPASRSVIMSDADVVTFLTLVQTGATYTPTAVAATPVAVSASDHRGDDIVSSSPALELFQRSRA